MIIGLTGTFGSGKGSVAEILKEKGFVYYSCSDYLRGELKKKGIETTIPNLAKLGNEIRAEFGAGEISKRLLKQIKEANVENAIVDSLRHPEEINALSEEGNFVLFAIDADIKLRYKRVSERKRIGDNVTFEEFTKQEKQQMKGIGTNMQLSNAIKMADYLILNNGTLEELRKKIDFILANL
jgi:dephospho-CoA kinase